MSPTCNSSLCLLHILLNFFFLYCIKKNLCPALNCNLLFLHVHVHIILLQRHAWLFGVILNKFNDNLVYMLTLFHSCSTLCMTAIYIFKYESFMGDLWNSAETLLLKCPVKFSGYNCIWTLAILWKRQFSTWSWKENTLSSLLHLLCQVIGIARWDIAPTISGFLSFFHEIC